MAKEVKKVRGTARFFDDDSLEFIPQQTGSPVQKDVKKVRKSSFYKTNGEKESSMVMHLNVDANSTDPVAELTEDFDKLLKNVSPKAEKKLSGKKLMDEDGTTVYVSRKDHKMQICRYASTWTWRKNRFTRISFINRFSRLSNVLRTIQP